MRIIAAVVLAVVGAGCASAPRSPATATATVASASALRWAVNVHDDLTLEEHICRADDVAMTAIEVAGLAPVAARARDVATPPVLVDGCAVLRIDLLAAAVLFHDRATAVRAGDQVVLASPDVWLWTTPRPVGGTLALTTASPAVRAALPFPRHDDGTHRTGPETFEVDASTWRLLSTAAFGELDVRSLVAAGAEFHVVTLPGERHMVAADIDRWLGAAAEAVATGTGERGVFPFQRVLVFVEPARGGGVPFGMVTRGGGPQAMLLLGQQARIEDVVDDWVAVHELSHLLHPLVGLDEAWFGEGLATYHQVILRARAGLIDEEQAWALLRDGFERGAAAADRGPWTLPLREASARMRAEGRWVQTYWGGAAIALLVDVALRRCGGVGIDDVVATLRAEQPRVDARRIPARDIVARAAAVAPGCASIATDVEAMLEEPFPQAAIPMLEALGASADGPPRHGPLAAWRRAIVAAPRPRSGPMRGHLSAP